MGRLAFLVVALVVIGWAAIPAARAATLVACAHDAPSGSTASIAPAENVRFPASDGVQLSGWYAGAEDPSARGTVILVHGFKSSRSEMLDWATYLRREHYAVVLFDSRGCGQSDGVFGVSATEPRDIVGAAAYVRSRGAAGSDRIAVLGLSLGAGDAILAAAASPDIHAVIADSAWTDQRYRLEQMRAVELASVRVPVLPYETALLDRLVGARLEDARPIDVVGRLAPRPLLLIHGLEDSNATTTIEGAKALFTAAGEPKELWLVPGADHAGAIRVAPAEYRARTLAFLAANLR